jgi:hypothetical protein
VKTRLALALLLVALAMAPDAFAACFGPDDCGSGTGTGDGSVLEAAAPPATPASGFAKLWRDTVSGLLHWIDDLGGEHVLLEREEDSFSANSCLRGKNNRAEEWPGCAMSDEGVLGVPGLDVLGAGAFPRSYVTATNVFTPGGNISCMPWDGSRLPAQMNAGAISALQTSALFVNQLNPLRLRGATVGITELATPANYVAGEKFSMTFHACVLDGTPTVPTDCVSVDRIVFENSATPGTYGAGNRTAIACQSVPCFGTVAFDGGGLAVAGTTSFAAGDRDYIVACVVTSDDQYTADTDGDGAGPDAGAPGATDFTLTWDVNF